VGDDVWWGRLGHVRIFLCKAFSRGECRHDVWLCGWYEAPLCVRQELG
jgi:hypothetical protein